jgi:hypothetical protein
MDYIQLLYKLLLILYNENYDSSSFSFSFVRIHSIDSELRVPSKQFRP